MSEYSREGAILMKAAKGMVLKYCELSVRASMCPQRDFVPESKVAWECLESVMMLLNEVDPEAYDAFVAMNKSDVVFDVNFSNKRLIARVRQERLATKPPTKT